MIMSEHTDVPSPSPEPADRRISPDEELISLADAARHTLVVTAEDGVRHGGAGAFIVDAMEATIESHGHRGPITRILGVPREYIAQGKADDILDSLGLSGTGIAESVRQALQTAPAGQHQN